MVSFCRRRDSLGDISKVALKEQDIVLVQTRASRLGMHLWGQALFSGELITALASG
jgi:hypothetical protein